MTTGHITTTKKTDLSKLNGNITFIIPCAGMASRFKSVGAKALIQLTNEETLLERQVRILRELYPGCQIIVVIGFQFQRFHQLKLPGVRFVFNPIYEDTNVAFSIGLGLQASITDNVMVIYGDLIFNNAAVGIPYNNMGPTLFISDTMNNDEVGITFTGEAVDNMAFGLKPKWSQILYINGKELELFRKSCYDEKHWKWLGYEIVNDVIDKGGIFRYYRPEASLVYEIDSAEDLKGVRL